MADLHRTFVPDQSHGNCPARQLVLYKCEAHGSCMLLFDNCHWYVESSTSHTNTLHLIVVNLVVIHSVRSLHLQIHQSVVILS